MAIVSNGALIDVLRLHRLLPRHQLDELLSLSDGRCADVRALAKSLIQRGWFTVYQMNQLLAGNGAALRLGPYLILDQLGKGGQSEVYKARHTDYDWIVALKVVRAEHLAAPEAAAQFVQELEAMAEMDHPNIVQFLDVDKADGAYYCAMEFVEGTDLGKVVRLTGALPTTVAAEYARQTALGLQHAHEHNLVHRDIKPVNLYLVQPTSPRGKPAPPPLIKILDWGLANLRRRAIRIEHVPAVSGSGARHILGTADYLSPEQALRPEEVDIRGDLYSLGCTLYWLLTGQVPFNGASIVQKIIQHQTQDAPPVESLRPQVPSGLCAVVRRLMAKKPADRFQTPAALAVELTPFCPRPQDSAPVVEEKTVDSTLVFQELFSALADTPPMPPRK